MEKFDIKHPLRGPEYEHEEVKEQPFKEKIVHVVGDVNSFLKYKKDMRYTMDKSELRSDAHIKRELEKEFMLRTIMKYRLYGRDGVNDYELNKLQDEWRVIPKNKDFSLYAKGSKNAIRRKKKVLKTRFNKKTGDEE